MQTRGQADHHGKGLERWPEQPTGDALQHKRKMALMASSFELCHTLVYAALVLGIAYFGYLSVGELAGARTSLSLALYGMDSPFINFSVYFMGPGGCGIGAAFYLLYKREKRKRSETVRRLSDHARALEQKIDPNRSSSGLMPDGSTNPSDM